MTSDTPSSTSLEPINDIPELHALDVQYKTSMIAKRPTTWDLSFTAPPLLYSADNIAALLTKLQP
jgi:hypothetical protein